MTSRRIPGKKPRIISNPSSIAEIRDPRRLSTKPKHYDRNTYLVGSGGFISELTRGMSRESLKINLGKMFDGSKFFRSSKTYRPNKK